MRQRTVLWSVDTRDYRVRRTAERIAAQVERQVRPGSIVIFHDGGGNQANTLGALRLILPKLKAEGYQFATVSQLLEMGKSTT